MSMTLSTDSGISLTTNIYAAANALMHAQPHIVFDRFAKQETMPKNKKTTIQWRRVKPWTASTVPLQEGVTPTARKFEYEKVNTNLQQYGDLAELTDVIEDTAEDPVMLDASAEAGANVGRTKEQLTYATVRGGTNITYQNGTARTDVNTPPTLNKLRLVVQALERQKALKHTKVLDGSPKYGTKAIEAAYIAICHTDVKADIRNLPGFTPVAEYGTMKTVHELEFGCVEDVRFVCSADLTPFQDAGGARAGSGTSMVSTSGTSADVYPIIVFGQEAFGTVTLRGFGSVSPTILPANKPSKSDPMGQRGYIATKFWHAACRLNEMWLMRWEVAVTAL